MCVKLLCTGCYHLSLLQSVFSELKCWLAWNTFTEATQPAEPQGSLLNECPGKGSSLWVGKVGPPPSLLKVTLLAVSDPSAHSAQIGLGQPTKGLRRNRDPDLSIQRRKQPEHFRTLHYHHLKKVLLRGEKCIVA